MLWPGSNRGHAVGVDAADGHAAVVAVEVPHSGDGHIAVDIGDGEGRQGVGRHAAAIVVDGVVGGRVHHAVDAHLHTVEEGARRQVAGGRAHDDHQAAVAVDVDTRIPVDDDVQAEPPNSS